MEIKEAYQEKVTAQLQEWRSWVERYTAQKISFTRPTAPETERNLRRLADTLQIAEARLNALRQNTGGSWEIAKQAVERAMIDLKQVLDECGVLSGEKHLRPETNRTHIYTTFEKRGEHGNSNR